MLSVHGILSFVVLSGLERKLPTCNAGQIRLALSQAVKDTKIIQHMGNDVWHVCLQIQFL